ncbi:MAG: substrate-binding domain-containing protein, partial [Pedobacter sp.]|uniref:substrate-binding domain-containing protein n=1 Tax=Pedobacter sp. TaxID=1411316 RepID=UPI003567EF77
ALEKVQLRFKLDSKPDAIFAVNDSSAIISIQYLQGLGYRIPQDVAVIGYNNEPVSKVVSPTLTTIMQPSYEVGKIATQLLIDEIEHDNKEFVDQVLNSELIIRSSS